MFVKLTQATAITATLYVLLGLNTIQSKTTQPSVELAAEPAAEVIVALKEVFSRR
ncbi:MAG: hypothetical protein AAFR58_05370 [Cyanobacteria bacterium J06627_28]